MLVEREVKKGENHLTGKMIHEGLNQDASKMIDEDMKHFNRYIRRIIGWDDHLTLLNSR